MSDGTEVELRSWLGSIYTRVMVQCGLLHRAGVTHTQALEICGPMMDFYRKLKAELDGSSEHIETANGS